jgi:hypothetical protein
LIVRNSQATLCFGDSAAGYDLISKRSDFGHLPPYERWRSDVLLAGDPNGHHTVLKAQDDERAFLDLTFGHIVFATKGAIGVPPAFAAFGNVEWPALTLGDVWLQYAPAPEPPDLRQPSTDEWSGLIDDLETLAGIALGVQNDEPTFTAEMHRQMQQARG